MNHKNLTQTAKSSLNHSLPTNSLVTKKHLRTIIRQQRRSLSVKQQNIAAKKLIANIVTSQCLLRHKHIALYLENDGEISPHLLIEKLWQYQKKVYLPTINPLKKDELVFCLYKKASPLIKNRFGIKEPDFPTATRIPAKYLSLVFLPLVAFDEHGNRMGMGGGFYDKAFAIKTNKTTSRPQLIGLAHDFQKQNKLTVEAWDIPLSGVVTDKGKYLQGNLRL